MGLVTSSASTNNHNLYFSKDELAKILNIYSQGVSSGEWKDYAIDFDKNNAFFYIFKHSLAAPECILNKSLERNYQPPKWLLGNETWYSPHKKEKKNG